jgi:glucokinase
MVADCVIGVDLGGTKLLAGVVDRRLAVHHRAQRSSRGRDAAEVLDTVESTVREALEAYGGEVLGVGFGIPSLIDQKRGTAVSTVHLPLRDVPFRDVMAERLGLPVWLDNDANASLLAEARRGAAMGASDAVMLTLGTGIGGAVMVDGRLVRGASGAAGELGHMVVDIDGPICPCGNAGCLEVMASGTALGLEGARVARGAPDSALARAADGGREMTGMLVTELAHDGDRAARDVVALVGMRLGVGIANLVNALNPEVVVVGGGVIGAGDLLLEPARTVVRERALRPSRDDVRIEAARFGAESGMLGAALMAFDGLGGGRSGVAAA